MRVAVEPPCPVGCRGWLAHAVNLTVLDLEHKVPVHVVRELAVLRRKIGMTHFKGTGDVGQKYFF